MNYLIIIFIVILDQVTKFMVQSKFLLHESMPIIKNIFHFTYVQNVGAAFGILKHQKLFFIIITCAVIVGVFVFIRKQEDVHKLVIYSLSMIIGGAIGNLIDRVRFGYVVDFFDFMIWPVFNIADSFIVVGVIILSYYLIFIDGRKS